jgi:hypothetical protein
VASAVASYLLRSRTHAIAVQGGYGLVALAGAGLLAQIPSLATMLLCLSGLPLALVTLRRGAGEGALVGLGGGLGTALVVGLVLGNPLMGVLLGLSLGFSLWGPLWLAAIVLRRHREQGLALCVLAVTTVLTSTGMGIGTADLAAIWHQVPVAQRPKGVDETVFVAAMELATVHFGAWILCGLEIALLWARRWQAELVFPGGFEREFLALRLPLWFLALVVGAALLALLPWADPRPEVLAILLVVLCCFLFQGVAAAHGLALRRPLSRWWLAALYGTLIFAVPVALPFLAALGIADLVLDLRGLRRQVGAGPDAGDPDAGDPGAGDDGAGGGPGDVGPVNR